MIRNARPDVSTSEWNAREEEGHVSYHYKIDELPLEEGQWMILARTNYIANRIATDLKNNGYLFWRNGNGWSIANATLEDGGGSSRRRTRPRYISKIWRKIKVDRKTRRNKMLKLEPRVHLWLRVFTRKALVRSVGSKRPRTYLHHIGFTVKC